MLTTVYSMPWTPTAPLTCTLLLPRRLARAEGLDVVMVGAKADPPVVRMVEWSKVGAGAEEPRMPPSLPARLPPACLPDAWLRMCKACAQQSCLACPACLELPASTALCSEIEQACSPAGTLLCPGPHHPLFV